MRPDKKRYYILSAKINFREFKPHIPPLDLPLIILRDVAVRIQCSVGGGFIRCSHPGRDLGIDSTSKGRACIAYRSSDIASKYYGAKS